MPVALTKPSKNDILSRNKTIYLINFKFTLMWFNREC